MGTKGEGKCCAIYKESVSRLTTLVANNWDVEEPTHYSERLGHRIPGVVVWPLPKSKTSGLTAGLGDHSWPYGGSQARLHLHLADSVEMRPLQFSLRAASKGG